MDSEWPGRSKGLTAPDYMAVQRDSYVRRLEKEYYSRNKVKYFLNGLVVRKYSWTFFLKSLGWNCGYFTIVFRLFCIQKKYF